MRYVSLFSGVEAASVAWEPLGWEPLAFCEIEPFPCAVLNYRFPDVSNLGDVCKVDWKEFHERNGTVDVLVGGSPCQSFSIAGNREGLAGASGLMFEYIRAIRDLLRASGGRSPRYILWENVPGALSSERGVAFGQLLAQLDELGYGLAWRVLDAQFVRVPYRTSCGFFGPVPQRRRRVFLVGSLGTPGAAEILIEREGLRWDHPKGREAREALTERPEGGLGMGRSAGFKYHAGGAAKGIGYEVDSSPTLTADYHQPAVLTPWDVQSKRVISEDGVSPSLQSGTGEGMNIQPVVLTTANTGANGSNVSEEGVAYTLDLVNSNAVCIQGSMVGRSDTAGPQGPGVDEDTSFTLNTADRHAVAFAQNTRDEVRIVNGDGQIVGALTAQPGMKQTSYIMTQFGDVAGSLTARANSSPCVDRGQNVVCMQHTLAFDTTNITSSANGNNHKWDDECHTLAQGAHPPVVCMADDTAKAAIDEELCGSLKVGGGSPLIAAERTSPGRCAPGTTRASATST